ncbi:MAG: hypothetical protein ABH856_03510 [Patescibacteria group bacterium]
MKKLLTTLLAATLLFTAGCADTNDTAGTAATKADKELVAQLQTELKGIDKALLNEDNPDEEALTEQKKEAIRKLGEEYLKNDNRAEYSKTDDMFEDAIYVYEELNELIDSEEEGKEPVVAPLGSYIRRNIQIVFVIQKDNKKTYELSKRMYHAENMNAGNQNLYIDSAVNLAKEEFEKGNYEEAINYTKPLISIRYDAKALDVYAKSWFELAQKPLEKKDYQKAYDHLKMILPLVEDPEFTEKAEALKNEVKQHIDA